MISKSTQSRFYKSAKQVWPRKERKKKKQKNPKKNKFFVVRLNPVKHETILAFYFINVSSTMYVTKIVKQ